MTMELKTVFQATSVALVVGVAALALVACGGASSGDVPTTVVSSSNGSGTVSASDLTTAGDLGDADSWPGPPEEALAACDGKVAEAACSFTSPRDGNAVDGTCHARRDDASQLVCRPSDWPGRGERGDGPWGPSEEALSACQDIETGAPCSFESPFGTLDGTCSPRPDGSGEVACRPEWNGEDRPEGWGPGRGGQKHEEATAACADKEADAACSFESPSGSVTGTCRTGRDGSSLVCAPTDWPPR
jgi:hypothetical protein